MTKTARRHGGGRPRLPLSERRRTRSINLPPRTDAALLARTSDTWGPTQAASAMLERYLEMVSLLGRAVGGLEQALLNRVDKVLDGRALTAYDVALLPAMLDGAGHPEAAHALRGMDYAELCAVVDAVERRRSVRNPKPTDV